MKKIFLSVLLICILTASACGSSHKEDSSEYESENIETEESTTTGENMVDEEASPKDTSAVNDIYDVDGMFTEEWLKRQTEDYFKGFSIKKVSSNEEGYYQFTREVEGSDMVLTVNKEENHAILSYLGKEAEFDIPFMFGTTSAFAQMTVADMTGEGNPDFVYGYSYGTGSFEDRYIIYDLETMVPYEIETDVRQLIEKLKIEPLAILDTDYVLTRITDDKKQTYLAKVVKWNDETLTSVADFSFDIDAIMTSICKKDDKLYAQVLLTLDKAAPWQFLGAVNLPYAYDKKTKSFGPDGTMSEVMVNTPPVTIQPPDMGRTSADTSFRFSIFNDLDDEITITEAPFIQKETGENTWETMLSQNQDQEIEPITIPAAGREKMDFDVTGYDLEPDNSYRIALKVTTGKKYEATSFVIYGSFYLQQ